MPTAPPPPNQLYFGDNLAVLREHLADATVDLVYLDPPFNSNASYNVLFADRTGTDSHAQIQAFDDTWHWTIETQAAYEALLTSGHQRLGSLVQAFFSFLRHSDLMAYLVMMAPRLLELHRVLKPTGSLYLHCDPTASHYLKLLLDAIFGPESFRSEIVWKRTAAHSDTRQGRKIHGHIHDVIFFYSVSDEWTWNPVYTAYDESYVTQFYRHVDGESGRRFRVDNLTAARPGGDTEYLWRVKREMGGSWQADLDEEYKLPKEGWEYRGVPPYNGRYWAYSQANMREFERQGLLYYTASGMPNYKRYLDEMPGVALQDLWEDIPPISARAAERLGYPTQKPEALLERIIQASSNEGDLVLDPFCGCGTTVAVAERLKRRWIGIDITPLAVNLMIHRLESAFGADLRDYRVLGMPVDLDGAKALAEQDKRKFELWALGLVGAAPWQSKKGADRGIDGFLSFLDDGSGKAKTILVQVKGGHIGAAQVRDLRGTIERENAAIGAFICLEPPTGPMRKEAAAAGFYQHASVPGKQYPRLQLLPVAELLGNRVRLECPDEKAWGGATQLKKAPKARKSATHPELDI